MTAAALVFSVLAPFALSVAPPAARDIDTVAEAVETPAPPTPAVAAEPWQQVHILERFTIRISPGAPMPPQALYELDQDEPSSRARPPRTGKCVAVGQIAAVQSAPENRLLLFMRDQRMIAASLEKACRSSEFYSGFYMARSPDGQLCVERDILQSRTGASCRIKRWRELPVPADRRFP